MTKMKTGMFRYHGRSMWPCFQDGDLLEFEPCALEEVRVGDCVAYAAGDGTRVAHRVVAKGDYLTTRGDAMPNVDNDVVTADQIAGKIIRRHRLGNVSQVNGGLCGSLAGRFYHFAGRIDPQRNAIGGRIARGLRTISMAVCKRFWDRGRQTTLTSSAGQEVIFWMIGKKVIGKKNRYNNQWQIAWPWNIVVAVSEDQ